MLSNVTKTQDDEGEVGVSWVMRDQPRPSVLEGESLEGRKDN